MSQRVTSGPPFDAASVARSPQGIWRGTIEDQCRHLHGRYVKLVPMLREMTVAVRKAVVPPTRAYGATGAGHENGAVASEGPAHHRGRSLMATLE